VRATILQGALEARLHRVALVLGVPRRAGGVRRRARRVVQPRIRRRRRRARLLAFAARDVQLVFQRRQPRLGVRERGARRRRGVKRRLQLRARLALARPGSRGVLRRARGARLGVGGARRETRRSRLDVGARAAFGGGSRRLRRRRLRLRRGGALLRVRELRGDARASLGARLRGVRRGARRRLLG